MPFALIWAFKETSEARLRQFKQHLMMLSEARQIFFKAMKYLFTTCPLKIIYFMKIQSSLTRWLNGSPSPSNVSSTLSSVIKFSCFSLEFSLHWIHLCLFVLSWCSLAIAFSRLSTICQLGKRDGLVRIDRVAVPTCMCIPIIYVKPVWN